MICPAGWRGGNQYTRIEEEERGKAEIFSGESGTVNKYYTLYSVYYSGAILVPSSFVLQYIGELLGPSPFLVMAATCTV